MSSEPMIRALPRQKIGRHNTALVVIDMERDFVDEGAIQETPGGRALVPTINLLTGWARGQGVPVIFTHEQHRADRSDYGIELEFDPVHCLEGTAGCELAAGLEVGPQDHRIFGKRRYDAFLGTDLDLLLRSKKIENLICCGVTTHVCVMSTVFTARNLDYRVLLARDAVAAVSAAHQQAALLCMSDVFAYITTCAELMALWPTAADMARSRAQ